ncbi:Hypp3663 [Branchiostoma lanceolatum]|uniref:Hypp3663 protein n=1 Tax=Branchiostoma lanceolatum TaxID=7740 RepID=A0A8K0A5V3_BRALA|nr:Hypp3663 [Branchiostoma lanceolatum]
MERRVRIRSVTSEEVELTWEGPDTSDAESESLAPKRGLLLQNASDSDGDSEQPPRANVALAADEIPTFIPGLGKRLSEADLSMATECLQEIDDNILDKREMFEREFLGREVKLTGLLRFGVLDPGFTFVEDDSFEVPDDMTEKFIKEAGEKSTSGVIVYTDEDTLLPVASYFKIRIEAYPGVETAKKRKTLDTAPSRSFQRRASDLFIRAFKT